MKVLVTGAAGFIGSNLAEKLLKRGDDVVGLDNFNDYYDPQKKRENEARLSKYPHFRMSEMDICNREKVLTLFEAEKFDVVAHLAAMAGVRNAIQFPELYINVDYNGTQNLMDAARFNEVGNFVFASTSSVYGDTRQIPFVEVDPCDRPLQPYAAAKRAAEILGYTYHHLFGQNFTVLRFFTVYGPNGRPDMMAYLVAESITKGIQIPLYDGGEMWRDWTYVDDIVRGIILALDKPLGYNVLNLGKGEPTKLSEFIHLLEKYAGQKGNFIAKPRLKADVVKTYSDTSKARKLLGYNPEVSVEQGVLEFWQWYMSKAAALEASEVAQVMP